MSGLLRSIKNVTNGYTPAQVKVRNATSNEEFGPSTHELHEIAELTRSNQELFFIMDMIDKRLNDKGKNWRHVLKSLTLLDYLVRNGSDNVIIWCRENLYVIKSLREFQYRDEAGEDHGVPIRQRAKELTSLLNNSDRLRAERASARGGRRRPTRESRDSDGWRSRERLDRPSRYRNERERSEEYRAPPTRRTPEAEQDDLQRAIELSKQTVEEDEKRRAQLRSGSTDLNKAMQASVQQQQTGLYTQEDWAKYQAAQQEYQQYQQQLAALQAQQAQQTQQAQQLQQAQTGYDTFQPQTNFQTGYNTGDQSNFQSTGAQNGFQNTGIQPQALGFQPQASGFQPQATGFQHNGYGNQENQGYQNSGAQTFGGYQNQYDSPAPLQPVKTGSNNPFAQPTGQPTGHQGHAQHAHSHSGYATYPQGNQPLQAQHTNNPFQQQYTGIATTQMQPSHTGYGFGNARGGGGDSLIDL